jgi:hypothetical protein
MNKQHLGKLWAAFALSAFVFIVGSVVVIQGGNNSLGAKLLVDASKDGKPAVGYFVAIIGGTLLSLALAVAILHARRHGAFWHDRFPVIWLDGLNTGTCEGRIFQVASFVILVLLPVYGLGRSIEVANRGWLCEQASAGEQPKWHPGGEWRLLALPAHRNQLRLMNEGKGKDCQGSGVEVGWWTPVLMVMPPATAFLLLLVLLRTLVRKQRRGG